MSGQVMRVAWYWFGANFTRRRIGFLTIVLIIGLVGGVAIGAITAARRTEGSFKVFLQHTDPSDMGLLLYAPNETAALSRLAHVKHVETMSYNVFALPAGKGGAPRNLSAFANGDVVPIGSLNGEYFTQDKVAVLDRRMANPRTRERVRVDRCGRATPRVARGENDSDVLLHDGTSRTARYRHRQGEAGASAHYAPRRDRRLQ
jgi:hypothetical protein